MTRKVIDDTDSILKEMAGVQEKESDINQLNKKPPKGYKINPLYIETKTRRLQLVLRPSLYDKVKKKAEKANLSVNEFIHRVLEKAIKE